MHKVRNCWTCTPDSQRDLSIPVLSWIHSLWRLISRYIDLGWGTSPSIFGFLSTITQMSFVLWTCTGCWLGGIDVVCRRLIRLSVIKRLLPSAQLHAALWSVLRTWCGSQVSGQLCYRSLCWMMQGCQCWGFAACEIHFNPSLFYNYLHLNDKPRIISSTSVLYLRAIGPQLKAVASVGSTCGVFTRSVSKPWGKPSAKPA